MPFEHSPGGISSSFCVTCEWSEVGWQADTSGYRSLAESRVWLPAGVTVRACSLVGLPLRRERPVRG